MQRVLITGAWGGIGRSLRETLRGVYPVLRLSDRVALAPAQTARRSTALRFPTWLRSSAWSRVWTALSISAEIPAKTPGT